MIHVDMSEKIVEILESQCFVNFFQFRQKSDNSRGKLQKDRIKVGVAVNIV